MVLEFALFVLFNYYYLIGKAEITTFIRKGNKQKEQRKEIKKSPSALNYIIQKNKK